ncbi:MAG: 2-oxo acid dehydrogenase subunit E2 [Porphyromonadaceae bacterium]|nr:MAG: 2-oxo acid dehydrogenase subunit E2 [Porphyromonadaceae bacterium]
MANPVIMPRQGQSVESCIISSWFKNEGDEIQKGDILFSHETDKAAFECESEFAGILLKRLYQEGDEVPVLKIVAIIGTPGESIDQFSDESVDSTHEGIVSVESKEVEDFTAITGLTVARLEGEKIRITPRARNRAKELGISFEGIQGSGPEGRIIEQDIILAGKSDSFATPPASSVGEEFEIRKLSNMRKIIAAKMKESLQNSAQLTHHTSADARRLLELRKKAKESFEKGASENITINDMVCFAVIRALKKHPMVNCHLLGDTISIFHKVHLGLAVDTDRGLMVPTVKNADDLSIQRLAAQLKAVADNCKKGNINPELLASEAATFSVSNLGSYGVELFTPVINLPQVAILGVNTIINRPTDLGNGVFGFVPFIGLSLTYDHRAIDGAPASAFLREIRLEIENLDFTI